MRITVGVYVDTVCPYADVRKLPFKDVHQAKTENKKSSLRASEILQHRNTQHNLHQKLNPGTLPNTTILYSVQPGRKRT